MNDNTEPSDWAIFAGALALAAAVYILAIVLFSF